MARTRFRSQPNLQRTGGPSPALTLGVWALAAAALGSALAVRQLHAPHPPRPAAEVAQPASGAGAVSPAAERARSPAAPSPANTKSGPAPVVVARAAPPRAARSATRAASRPRESATAAPAGGGVEWDRRWRDYQRAREAYDAGEHDEGYRWARDNNVTLSAYCRATHVRDEAFMQGCLDYVRHTQG